MGASQFRQQNSANAFYVYPQHCSFSYPTNTALQERVTITEWNQFKDDLRSLLQRSQYMICAALSLLIVSFLLSIILCPYLFAIVIFLLVLLLFVIYYRRKKLKKFLKEYNMALFYSRGIFVRYHSSKHSKFLYGRIAHPATEQAAIELEDTENNSVFTYNEVITTAPPELKNRFREANEQFARQQSAISASSHGVQLGYAEINNTVIEMTAPLNAYPGSLMQVWL